MIEVIAQNRVDGLDCDPEGALVMQVKSSRRRRSAVSIVAILIVGHSFLAVASERNKDWTEVRRIAAPEATQAARNPVTYQPDGREANSQDHTHRHGRVLRVG